LKKLAVPVLAIDGPSGSGKGTLAQMLARHLGWHLLDSGALYRIVGLAAVERGVDLDDEAGLASVAEHLHVEFAATAPGEPAAVILDGRDMGRGVFRDAPLKIFLTASAEERAQRRHKQLMNKGESVNLAALLEDIRARDRRDSERAVAPLKPAPDALVIDSTQLAIEAVFQQVLQWSKERELI